MFASKKQKCSLYKIFNSLICLFHSLNKKKKTFIPIIQKLKLVHEYITL
jgi:hypothetical protein